MARQPDIYQPASGPPWLPDYTRAIERAIKRSARLMSFTVTALPSGEAGDMIFVSNESGGAVPAFFDGTNWRRVTDRAIVS